MSSHKKGVLLNKILSMQELKLSILKLYSCWIDILEMLFEAISRESAEMRVSRKKTGIEEKLILQRANLALFRESMDPGRLAFEIQCSLKSGLGSSSRSECWNDLALGQEAFDESNLYG